MLFCGTNLRAIYLFDQLQSDMKSHRDPVLEARAGFSIAPDTLSGRRSFCPFY